MGELSFLSVAAVSARHSSSRKDMTYTLRRQKNETISYCRGSSWSAARAIPEGGGSDFPLTMTTTAEKDRKELLVGFNRAPGDYYGEGIAGRVSSAVSLHKRSDDRAAKRTHQPEEGAAWPAAKRCRLLSLLRK